MKEIEINRIFIKYKYNLVFFLCKIGKFFLKIVRNAFHKKYALLLGFKVNINIFTILTSETSKNLKTRFFFQLDLCVYLQISMMKI